MKKDDWVLLGFPAANRDPEVFEDADKFIIDRAINRHAAFGLGHPSLRRVESGSHGAARRDRGVHRALSAFRTLRSPTPSPGRRVRSVVRARFRCAFCYDRVA